MDKSTVVLSKTKIDSDLHKFEWSKKPRLKKRLSIFYMQNTTVIEKDKITAKGFVGKDHNCKEVLGHLHANALL